MSMCSLCFLGLDLCSGALRTFQASVSTKLTFRGYCIDHVLASCIAPMWVEGTA